ncbi:MAG TPA: hypothetical protein VFU63_04275 [Ktedonobacterales bacterium]|nr:hypothetical protein [Ktedonobacterales bacterium]
MRWRWWFNTPMLWLLRSPLHGIVSGSMLAIRVRGRISGRMYTLPVNYLQNGLTLLILSTRDRTWWRNLEPKAPVTLWLRGRRVQAMAQAITSPEEVIKGLLVVLRRSPRYQRSLGVALDAQGNARQNDQLARAASQYVVIRIALSAFSNATAAETLADEYTGGRIV